MSYPTVSTTGFEDLDNYDLEHEYSNLIEGMATFTEESKQKYSEAWAYRKAKKKAIENEFKKRGIEYEKEVFRNQS